MDLCNVMRKMVSESGKSHRELAHDLGRGDAYVSVAVSNVCAGRDVGVSRLVSIADACGYDVTVVDRSTGVGVTID